MRPLILIASLLTCLHGIGQDDMAHERAQQHMHQRSFDELVARFEAPERDSWQRPDLVLERLGDLEGLTVLDLGCGTGYFALRMAQAGAHVICADVDERFLAYVEEQRKHLGNDVKDRISTRLVPPDDARLAPGEVDLVLTVNTYHHIDQRSDYFTALHDGIRNGGRLVVVDFRPGDLPMGPPEEMKVADHTVLEELYQAGFIRSKVDEHTLPYQYIITMWRQ
jgi:SAM-dependent methyltransferase